MHTNICENLLLGSLRTKYPPYQPEEEIIVLALIETNIPKLVEEDVAIFRELIVDFFPQAQLLEMNTFMKPLIEDALQQNGLGVVDKLVSKIQQLYQTIRVRQGVMLVGSTATGKTTSYKILASILPKLEKEFEAVKYYVINPKSMEMASLWGEFNKNNSEWSEGLIATIARKVTSDESASMSWVVFDGL
jgi:dynein heavy chain